jgi:hypothetical protein
MTSSFLDLCKDLLSGSHPFLVVIVLLLGICYLRSVKLNLSIGDRPKKRNKNA